MLVFVCFGDGSRDLRGGRSKVSLETRQLIREMSWPLWGAPRIHGELLEL